MPCVPSPVRSHTQESGRADEQCARALHAASRAAKAKALAASVQAELQRAHEAHAHTEAELQSARERNTALEAELAATRSACSELGLKVETLRGIVREEAEVQRFTARWDTVATDLPHHVRSGGRPCGRPGWKFPWEVPVYFRPRAVGQRQPQLPAGCRKAATAHAQGEGAAGVSAVARCPTM